MNTKSIRFRIVLWYSLTLFLATAVIFASFYFVTRQILFGQVDKEITIHSAKLSEIATRQGSSSYGAIFKQQLYNEFSNLPGMVVVLLDHNGIVIRSSLSPETPYVSYNFLFQQAENSPKPIYHNQKINNTQMRFIAQQIRGGEELLGVILVAHPIEAIQKSLNSLLTTLISVLVFLIIPTIIGGKLIAGKIVRPISVISEKMSQISSEHLEQRALNPGSGDEIEKLVVSFNGLLDRLQDSFIRERQFIGDMAHELKTPIATLKSGIELTLSKARSKNEYRESIADTLIDTNRLSTTIKNILDLAWLGADNARHLDTLFDLSATFADLKEVAIKLATQKHIIAKINIDSGVIVSGAQDKISRAILNLIDNAIKFTPSGGSISLSLHQKNSLAIIQIKDTGVGISKVELPHIFERFYRGSKVAKTLGTGLGLAITQGIVVAHKGKITINSKLGRGTNVIVSLPLTNS